MSVVRVNKTSDYTIISNRHLKEKEMSLKAKGLLTLMLSLPDDWDYSINGLVAICKENKTAVKNTLNELKKFGYLTVTKLWANQTESKKIEYVYNVYEVPQSVENQDVENQGVGFLYLGNQPQLNTNKSITNKLNTKELNTKDNNTLSSSSTIAEIVDYLNSKTSKNYRASTRKTKSLINARMNEGFTVDDFKKVIDNKTAEWLNTKMEQYLRPETLFGTKFESYLNQNVSIDTSKNVDTDYYNSDEYAKLVEQSNLELEKEMASWGLD